VDYEFSIKSPNDLTKTLQKQCEVIIYEALEGKYEKKNLKRKPEGELMSRKTEQKKTRIKRLEEFHRKRKGEEETQEDIEEPNKHPEISTEKAKSEIEMAIKASPFQSSHGLMFLNPRQRLDESEKKGKSMKGGGKVKDNQIEV